MMRSIVVILGCIFMCCSENNEKTAMSVVSANNRQDVDLVISW